MVINQVAVLGLGRMGAAMADTLSRAGFSLTVWNRSHDTAERVAAELGATVADSPAAAASAAQIVVSSLADDAALEAVHLDGEGTVAGVRPGTVVVETSTVDPETILRLAPEFEKRGAHLLDSPVSGSVGLVAQGALTSMVGGDEHALATARPVIDALSRSVFHMGPSGSGATMKLAVNALVHAINLALSESLVLAEAGGIERSLAYEVFANSAAGSPFIQYKRPAFESPDETPVAFDLDLVAKDLRLILGLADRLGVPMAQGAINAAVANSAIEAGLGDADMSALAVHLRA
jgi:3-hydroxyisobutyrate dehydrogenase/2-hydroxy-3-oxopropionate reductase